MKFIRNLLALIGLVSLLGAGYAYVRLAPALAEFDSEFPRVYGQLAQRLLETGDPGVAMMWAVEVDEGLTPEDVIESLKSLATSRNFLFVGESPFYKQIKAITGEDYRYVNFLSFCDAKVGKIMLEYRDQYSGFMPCRIALVENKQGRLWLYSMNLELMIHGGKALPPEMKESAQRVSKTIQEIMEGRPRASSKANLSLSGGPGRPNPPAIRPGISSSTRETTASADFDPQGRHPKPGPGITLRQRGSPRLPGLARYRVQPGIQLVVDRRDTLAVQGGEARDLDAFALPRYRPPYLSQLRQGGAALELILLGQQQQDGALGLTAPFQHALIELREGMANVHHDHQPHQGPTLMEVSGHQVLPLELHRLGDPGIAIAGQVDQPPILLPGREEDDLLGAPRGLAGAGQLALITDQVDGAGLTGIGASGEGHFAPRVGGGLVQARRGAQKIGLAVTGIHGVKGTWPRP